MGGHAHGDVAAQITLDCLGGAFRSEAKPKIADPDRFLFNIIGRAHAMILHQTQRLGLAQDAASSPRTTVVACLVQDGYAYWSFVGDSRLYVLRDGRILARTRDHTPVQMLIDAGRIREEAAATHPDRNKLLQCLGGPRAPRVEPTAHARLAEDDVVLLCSDGFWGPLTQRQLLMGVLGKDLKKALPELITLAETRAGPRCDNISVLAIQWQTKAVAAPVEPMTVPMDEAADRRARLHRHRARFHAHVRRRDRAPDRRDQEGAEEARPRQQMRPGGRKADELRAVRMTRGYTRHAEGSVLVEFGDTKVLCTASVEERVPPFLRDKGRGWVTAEYGMLPRATHTRGDREAARGKQSRPHAGDPAPDRPRAARGDRPAGAGRAHASRSTATCCRPTAARAPPRSPARSSPCTTRLRWMLRQGHDRRRCR